MPYVSVYVDINMEEIDTDDLVKEICRRMDKVSKPQKLSEKVKQLIKKEYTQLSETLNITSSDRIEVKTLEDQMKYNHLASIWNKYTSSQIESLLP